MGDLSEYIYPENSNVFVVKSIPGITGAVFARYSRSVGGVKEVLKNEFIKDGMLDAEKADQLVQRVLIAYGDDSVGELEGAHVSIESISNLATKEIEDRRIGLSPIEQSTRYVFYDKKDENGNWKYYIPPELEPDDIDYYKETMDFAFEVYSETLSYLMDFCKNKKPIDEAEYDVVGDGIKRKLSDLKDEIHIKNFKMTYNNDIKTRACDSARSLLPTATLTNVGVFGNGRSFQNLITHLASHDLYEMNYLSDQIKISLSKDFKNYVKRGGFNQYLFDRNLRQQDAASKLKEEYFDLRVDKQVESSVEILGNLYMMSRICCLLVYPYLRGGFYRLYDIINMFEDNGKIIKDIVGERENRRDKLPRAFETGYPLMFEVVSDFGSYRDIQRHRMMSQHRQLLTTSLGFEYPPDIEEITGELKEKITKLNNEIENLYDHLRIKYNDFVAQYCVLFGYRLRYILEMNIREACHFTELRSSVQGHPSYRKVAQKIHDLIRVYYGDTLFDMMKFVNHEDVEWCRAESESKQRIKENKI